MAPGLCRAAQGKSRCVRCCSGKTSGCEGPAQACGRVVVLAGAANIAIEDPVPDTLAGRCVGQAVRDGTAIDHVLTCRATHSIPDDHIDPRRSALFAARLSLRDVRGSLLISLHKHATMTPKIRAAIEASSEPAWLMTERYGISG